MPFLGGFLSGVVSQRQRYEDQAREDAQSSQAREDAVLQHLATSDDPEVKALGVAGILQSTSPKKRKSGFQGWLGELQDNPAMAKVRALVAHDQAVGHLVPDHVAHAAGQHMASGDPATGVQTILTGTPAAAAPSAAAPGTPAGSPHAYGQPPTPPAPPSAIAAPPEAAGSAAQPADSLTEIGSAPPRPTVPNPSAGEAGASAGLGPVAAGGQVLPSGATAFPAAMLGRPQPPIPGAAAAPASPTGPTPGTPQPAASPIGGAPPAVGRAQGPAPSAVMGQPARPPITTPAVPREVFRSPETQARLSKVAATQGDVEGLVAGLKAAGLSDEEIRQEVKLRYGRGAAGYANQSIAGEAPGENGKFQPTFGVFNRATGQYHDPESGQPIAGFRPKAGAPARYGTALEAATQRLFGVSYGQATQEQQKAAEAEVEAAAGRTTKARGTATTEVKLDAPIGVANALRYGVPATTTLRQLQDKIPLSQADQDKVHGISTLEGTLNEVEALVPKVFPKVEPGLKGRLQTALSLFSQSVGRSEDLTKLHAAIASTMAGIVRANGVTQRLNQKELDLAQQQMIDTSALHGDTLVSAQAKLEILRDLLSRVEIGPVGQEARPQTQPGPPPAPGATPVTPARVPPRPQASGAGKGPNAPVAGLHIDMATGQLVTADGRPFR